MSIVGFVVGPMENNIYLVFDPDTGQAALIDPGIDSQGLLDYLRGHKLTLEYIINTHGHLDHIFNNAFFKEATNAKLLIHQEDLFLLESLVRNALLWGLRARPSPAPDGWLEDGQVISVGNLRLQVIHTPGHSPGSVSLYLDQAVLVGDALFAGSMGRTDLAGGSLEALLTSVRSRLFVLPEDTVVYPGHGPATTIGREKRFNPFFQEEKLRWLL